MLICFPMGGTGQRFVQAGYSVPKPLLPLGEKRLIQWAMTSVEGLGGRYHYLPTIELAMHPLMSGLLPPGCWHAILEPTPGPLQTMLQADSCLQTNDELLICDCDSILEAKELKEAIDIFRLCGANGGVTLRRTTDPHCSYAEVDKEWWVSQTREKDTFTPWSTTGPYWFRSAKQFLLAGQRAAAASHVSISPVYNYLTPRTKAVPIATFHHLGTPEEYERASQEETWWKSLVPSSPS